MLNTIIIMLNIICISILGTDFKYIKYNSYIFIEYTKFLVFGIIY